METSPLPKLIIAADWSKNDDKRWMVRAELIDNEIYVVAAPEPVGNIETLFSRIENQVSGDSSVLMGFDFPIGVPGDYASRGGFSEFRAALPPFGTGEGRDFYEITDAPNRLQPF